MSDLAIRASDDLTLIAFKVCTALDRAGYRSVLTGGSAATVYSPQAYQSEDLDYIASFGYFKDEFDQALNEIGFFRRTHRVYEVRPKVTPVTLEFPDDEIRIGNDYVKEFETRERDGMILRILSATDCVRDRLCSYFYYDSLSALGAAVAVAQVNSVDVDAVKSWSIREGETEKFGDFLRRLEGT